MSEARQTQIMERSFEIGSRGSEFINDTGAHTGTWRLIIPIESTVFATLTDAGLTGSLVGETIPANHFLYGNFTAITLTSGAVMAYV